MNYWLDCFTGTTWNEFQKAGARVSGFNERYTKWALQIGQSDILLCYMVGVMRWIGALEVLGRSQDQTRIWKDAEFPVRFEVKPLILLNAEQGVPMEILEGKVSFYRGPEDRGKFKGFVRFSPNLFKEPEDARTIFELLRQAQSSPIDRPVDPKKLARPPYFRAERLKGKTKTPLLVSVPDSEDEESDAKLHEGAAAPIPSTRHTEIQYYLLSLGAELGLELWVARNDRSKYWQTHTLGDMPNLLDELPTQFNEATTRTIELIDVLWLKGNSIVAAFEIECTTSVYSGLLRMSDLLALQPNLDIRLYLVAPDDRRPKVEQEMQRPTFKMREKPLPVVCGYLPFSKLVEKVEGIRKLNLGRSLKPDFLETTAEYFGNPVEEA